MQIDLGVIIDWTPRANEIQWSGCFAGCGSGEDSEGGYG